MPDQPDDNLIPPVKVMRKRLNGVYRSDSGFSGPTRRYVLIVALLVGLASVPTLAAITAGSNQLAGGKTDTMDIPFLPPASPGPVRARPYRPPAPASPSPSPSPSAPRSSPSAGLSVVPTVGPSAVPTAVPSVGAVGVPSVGIPSAGPTGIPSAGPSPGPVTGPSPAQGASPDTETPVRASRLIGEAGQRRDRPRRSGRAEGSYAGSHAKPPGAARSPGSGRSAGSGRPGGGAPTGSSDLPSVPGPPARSGFPSVPGFPSFPGLDRPPAGPAEPAQPGEPSRHDQPAPDQPAGPDQPSPSDGPSPSDEPDRPDGPDEPPAWAGRPFCHERGRCADPSRHHRSDGFRHRPCDNTNHRVHWSHHRSGAPRTVTVHIDPADRHGHRRTIRHRPADAVLDELLGSVVSHRSQDDRSEHSRRSAVTERPQNVRPTNTLERGSTNGGYHSRRRIPEARTEENQIANRSYRGSHRADSQHHADDQTRAQQRSSRVGRHHADHHDDHANRR